jgi:hypothetical protein
MQKNILIITGILFALEFYVYQAFKTVTNNSYLRIGYWTITILVYLFFIYEVFNFKKTDRDHHRIQLFASVFLIFILPKLFVIFFLIIEDFGRVLKFILQKFGTAENYFPERRTFLSLVGLVQTQRKKSKVKN